MPVTNGAALVTVTAAVLATAAAARAFLRRPSLASLSFGAGMLAFAVAALASTTAHLGINGSNVLTASIWRQRIWALAAPLWVVFSLSYSRFQPGLTVRKWLGMICAIVLVGLFAAFSPASAIISGSPEFGLRLGTIGYVVQALLIVSATLVLANLEHTFRASAGVARWQLKFLVIGLGVLFLTRIYLSTQIILYRTVNPSNDMINAFAVIIASILAHLSFGRGKPFALELPVPVAAPYRSIVVVLIGAYLVAIGVIANAAAMFGWVGTFPIIAFSVLVAMVLAGLALASDRLRLQAKRFVSRVLRRPTHDFRRIWTYYNEMTLGQSDEAELSRSTVKLIAETFDMLSVTSWHLQPGGILTFGASTSLLESDAARLLENSGQLGDALDQIRKARLPTDLDAAKDDWAQRLRILHPVHFRRGGSRYCVPVRAGDELLGLIMVGDRVANSSTTTEELELLGCIADQLGRDLIRIRLSQRLAEGKEMQAFQTVATFFVHDLKNTASTLSLLLENLRVHFDRPAFREDAVRSLGKSVGRINEIVSRLGGLRHELKLNRVPSDLNDVVTAVLQQVEPLAKSSIKTSLGSLPPVSLDAEQMQKVVLNLILNAKEALQADGEISVETSARNGTALLTVRDNGMGMSADFIRSRLFRPFQTTKPKGIGIGMFQVKMIVEGHDGKISVESEPGKGTTFSVALPIAEARPQDRGTKADTGSKR